MKAKTVAPASLLVPRSVFEEIAEQFRTTILCQSDLITLMKQKENSDALPTLAICLDRFSSDLFMLSDRLNDLVEADTQ